MGNLGGAEILVILLVALIVLGPTKLPPAVRQVGKFVGEIRRMGQGFQQELESAGVVAGPVSWGTAEAKLSPQTAPATESGEDTQAVTDIVELDNVETPVESVPEVSVASETDSQMDTETRSSDIVS